MIALACDQGGFELMGVVRAHLDSKNILYKDFGTFSPDSCHYPEIAVPAAKAIVSGECDKGIFICGTGIGMSIAANKVPGIRAALCTNEYMADMARAHNDANVLALGGRVLKSDCAIAIVDTFLKTAFSGQDRHIHRVGLLNAADRSNEE
ncbi:MAG: ribose 5-phosphate isomerase B [Oscillospiraceae bacterium]|nr:ribose 5-phosphate isomerase B [Oscillospiraceae bacterium]